MWLNGTEVSEFNGDKYPKKTKKKKSVNEVNPGPKSEIGNPSWNPITNEGASQLAGPHS